MDSLIGKIIGPYRVLRKIGKGGMSVVFLAEDERLGRRVALKMLDQPSTDREKILTEARHLSQLNHPGIVTIHDVIDHPEGIFIVMEYVEGDSLENFLRTHRVDLRLALRLAKQIVETVKTAHEHNLIHGDLKPSNIIITPEGSIKLLDFGLSRFLDIPSINNSITGTFPYISPEQISGSSANEETDIYALGMILYQLVTGTIPLKKENQAAQIYAIMNETPVPPRILNKSVSENLNKIILRCLEKNVNLRYSSVKSLESDLKRVENDLLKSKSIFADKGIYWFIFILTIFFGIVVYFQIRMTKGSEPVHAISDLSLSQPVNLYFHYNLAGNKSPDAQARILGLIEILTEQLNRVNGINIEGADSITDASINSSPPPNMNRILVNFSLQGNEENAYHLEYQIENENRHEKIQSSVHWADFLDISWISNKILSQVLTIILGKRVSLLTPNKELIDNAYAYQYFSHGLYHFNEKNYTIALRNFNEALKINPFFTQATFYKGLSLYHLKEYTQAREAFLESLPEVNEKKFIEWQIKIPDSSTSGVYLKHVSSDQEVTNFLVLFSQENPDKLMLIDVEKKEKQYLEFPIPRKSLDYIYYNSGKFVFISSNETKPKNSLLIYNPQNNKWEYNLSIQNNYIISFPYFFFQKDSTNIIQWINLGRGDKPGTISLDHQLYGSFDIIPTSDPVIYIFKNSEQIYLLNIKEKTAEYLNELLPDFSSTSRALFGIRDYIIFQTSGENYLNLYHIFHKKIEYQFPLWYSENFGFSEYRFPSTFVIDSNTNQILVLEPDSLLHLYQLNNNGSIGSSFTFTAKNFYGKFQLINSPNISGSISALVLYDKFNGDILILNSVEDKIEQIQLEERIISAELKSPEFLYVSTPARCLIVDVSIPEIIWDFSGKRFASPYYYADKNVMIFFKSNEGVIQILNLSSMDITASYKISTGNFSSIQFIGSRMVSLEKNTVKVFDINKLIENTPMNISNVYQKIAECEYQLGNYNKSLEYLNRILEDFHPNQVSSLILKMKILDVKYGIRKSISLLPLVYNVYPEGSLPRKRIENELYRTGLYRWEQNMVMTEGNRILEVAGDKVLFADVKSMIQDQFWILRADDGSIFNNFSYKYLFNALVISPEKLFYCESENRDEYLDYFIRDISDISNKKLIDHNIREEITPKLYHFNRSNIIAFYPNIRQSPGLIQLINLDNFQVYDIYRSMDQICEPLIKDNKLYFISGKTCFTYNLDTQHLSSSYMDFTSKVPINFISVVDVNPDEKIWLVIIKNYCFRLNTTDASLEHTDKISHYFQNLGYVSTKNIIRIFNNSHRFSFSLLNDFEVEDIAVLGSKVYILQPDQLLVWQNGKFINSYPLLWRAIKFAIQKDTAYVLSNNGKIYALNLKWTFHKLKKDLILSLN